VSGVARRGGGGGKRLGGKRTRVRGSWNGKTSRARTRWSCFCTEKKATPGKALQGGERGQAVLGRYFR
jgi:hypothetical protein